MDSPKPLPLETNPMPRDIPEDVIAYEIRSRPKQPRRSLSKRAKAFLSRSSYRESQKMQADAWGDVHPATEKPQMDDLKVGL